MVAKELHAVSFREIKSLDQGQESECARSHQSSRWNLLMEVPHPSPEPSRLQHTITFLCILACVLMLFYLS